MATALQILSGRSDVLALPNDVLILTATHSVFSNRIGITIGWTFRVYRATLSDGAARRLCLTA